ncbi:hypothetical protein RRF57_009192 [Xylaria bambusicola]|uniref:Uncharacterized protein n=1 Tax=Xylaria bambusicola TaxID=326684 RepID=A0AAN7UPC4_9PEZI
MATVVNLSSLLDSLSNSLSSAIEATPKLAGIESIENGVSLLDVKNELLLSYLQNLVFLILIKIRNAKSDDAGSSDNPGEISGAVVKKLVELRLYLDKGVRPLEERLRFQLDKIIRAADDADRSEKIANDTQEAESDENSDKSDEEADEDDGELDDKARRRADTKQGPSFANFSAPVSVGMAAAATQDKTGVYRPPKITPVVMPTTERRERTERRPMKSATMNEYIVDELSTAPSALPSVGSNVILAAER